MCGKCNNGLSETTSDVGYCKECNDNSGLVVLIAPISIGILLIANFFRKGMRDVEVPHPFMIYMTKSALFVFQLFPFLTFQSDITIYQPITKVTNIDIDLVYSLAAMFEGKENRGDCVFSSMSARSKIMLKMLPGTCMLLMLITIEMIMLVFAAYRRRKRMGRIVELEYGRNNAIWNVLLVVYTQITGTLVKLTDCRGFGAGDTGNVKYYMRYAGAVECWDLFHYVCYVGFIACFLFPFILFFILKREKEISMKRLRRRFPTLTLLYRRKCWWYSCMCLYIILICCFDFFDVGFLQVSLLFLV